jgi:hypothetical protein
MATTRSSCLTSTLFKRRTEEKKMKSELFQLGVLAGMDKAAMNSASGMGIPADQSGKATPTMTAKSKGGPANATSKKDSSKTKQDGMAPNGTVAGENPNV